MEQNLSSILSVKINGVWTEIPALRGTGIHLISIERTERSIVIDDTTVVQYGWKMILYDEQKHIIDPNYTGDEIIVWDGLNGSGSVNRVDGFGATDGTDNVEIQAVSYGRVQTLTSAQKSQARTNINAQVSGNYIVSPNYKNINQFLQYLGNDTWTTAKVSVLPETTDTGVLVKTSGDMSELSWMSAIDNATIDEIIND